MHGSLMLVLSTGLVCECLRRISDSDVSLWAEIETVMIRKKWTEVSFTQTGCCPPQPSQTAHLKVPAGLEWKQQTAKLNTNASGFPN